MMRRRFSVFARRNRAQLKARRASVSVEFALISLFLLFPLVAGGIDMVLVLSARAKLNSALHAIYIFAWSDPGSAGDSAQLQNVIQAIDPTLPASSITLDHVAVQLVDSSLSSTATTPTTVNVCLASNGILDSSATPAAGPAATSNASDTCPNTDVAAVFAIYSLTSVIELPIPVPFLAHSITLNASGVIQVE